MSDADIAKAQECYKNHLSQHFTSANGQAVDKFINAKIFKNKDIKKVCTSKAVQDQIKKDAMSDIGMKKGMECKKEMEADCPKYKAALQDYNVSDFF